MNQLDELLYDFEDIKESITQATNLLESLKDKEALLKTDIANFMIDNGIERKTSPDGKYSASLTTRKSITVKDKRGLLDWTKLHRQDLLSVDLVATKKEMKSEPDIKQFFQVESVTSVMVSEIKEKVEIEETPAQFRERVRANQDNN